MSFNQNYGTYFQVYNEEDLEETIFTKEEQLEELIRNKLIEDAAEMEEIKENYRNLVKNSQAKQGGKCNEG